MAQGTDIYSMLVARAKRHSGLITYTLLNYGDKLLTFLIPLLVLYIFKDAKLYTEVEYIYSIAAILVIAIEGGIITYFLYAYKEAENRDALQGVVERSFRLQFLLYGAVGLILSLVLWGSGSASLWTISFINIRTLFAYAFWYLTIYYRVIDRPSRVFLVSYAANIGTIGLLLMGHYLFQHLALPLFFVSQFLVVLVFLVAGVRIRRQLDWAEFRSYFNRAWRYAWPVTVTVFLFMFVTHYGKIYARNFLNESEMYELSFAQRMAMIIQLAHSSAVGYLSKGIFIDTARVINRRHLLVYSAMTGGSVLLVFVASYILGYVRQQPYNPFALHSMLLIFYTLLWCFGSFLEMHLNKMNKNRVILIFAIVTAGLYFLLLYTLPLAPLVAITAAMSISIAVNVCLVIWYLQKLIGEHARTIPRT